MHGRLLRSVCILSLLALLGACALEDAEDLVADDVEGVAASEQGLSQSVSVGARLTTTATINFRSGPGFGYSKIGLLPRGAVVEALRSAPQNQFYNVRYQGKAGWAYGPYLQLASSPTPTGTTTPPPPPPPPGTNLTGGSGGALTDSTFLSYSNGQYTSRYHLYAAGLDWKRPVGLLVYTDGSGEYGLKNPGSTYLLAGTNGLINVAKRNNMVLLTPLSPNPACSDGDGSCWYLGDPRGYATWSAGLVKQVESRYNIAKNRVALGGYSSGAQWLTEYFAPGGHAADIMTDGVAVAISYGGSPKVTANFTPSFKANVHFNWNTGDRDAAYTTTSAYGVRAGYNWYTGNGFATSLDLISGLGHSRSDFGRVMEAQIKKHLPSP
jgi:hypothetical protein